MKNSLEIRREADRNCYNSIILQLILLNNLDAVSDMCQTGVQSTTYYSAAEALID